MSEPLTTLRSSLKGPWLNGANVNAIANFWSDCPPATALRLRSDEAVLNAIISASPYLCQLLRDHAEFAADCLESNPQDVLATLCLETGKSSRLPSSEDTGKALRHLKAKVALLLALADIGRAWTTDDVTRGLTLFADAAVQAAVNRLLREAHEAGRIVLADVDDPGAGSGYVVLAMGKHGAGELNYSSDIDLIVLFDPETAPMPPDGDAAPLFIRITKKLVALLQEQTVDGYVFRTDLRLRPDPRATQVAIALEAAAHYYENLGQNWERAAYIKARAVAGDIALGEEFLARLRPYIWRKYLDFAAIADVQSLIRQIHAVKGHGAIAVAGHNLKLGRGGIREIEFFVQTQQLIAGGRNPKLRGRSTIAMLAALADAQWITSETAADMQACYWELRRIEHRSQMLDDLQTHHVPDKPEALANFAHFCGHATVEAFSTALRTILETVQRHSARLFETSDTLGGDAGSLVFTGGEDDPDTIATLAGMGFRQASEVSATIRGWHFGRYAATRTRRAREDLTELMPVLLKALCNSGDADRTFIDFDRFLARLPAGVQLFAMLKANPDLLDLIAQILGSAPRLASELGARPRVLEAVLEPGFFGPLPTMAHIAATIAATIPSDVTLEEAMDRARIIAREQQFRVGVRVLSDTVSAEEAGEGFANVADGIIMRLLAAARQDVAEKHGTVGGARVAVIAMGKLGGREMTATSDLDLILVYDHAAEALQSDGARALSTGQYFQRLTQRFISAMTVPTAEGSLYEVDMRLRPSGSKGPVAVSLDSFKAYQADSAWTWERLALTRARVVAGDQALRDEIAETVALTLAKPRDAAQIRTDVVDMRRLMLREQKVTSPWDIKRVRGGLVEVEFFAQFLQLLHAPSSRSVLSANTIAALEALSAAGHLPAPVTAQLVQAARLYHRTTQLLRLCLDGPYDPETALPGLNQLLARAMAVPDVAVAEAVLRDSQAAVAQLFDTLVGPPN
jgi:[glutamine synthetase] adenylyltransferase / [glutamine synthetase]-adenylyl-L-tyrosine phosphorylase